MSCVSVSVDDAATESVAGEVIYKNPYSKLNTQAVHEATKSTFSTELDHPVPEGAATPAPVTPGGDIPTTTDDSIYSFQLSDNFKVRDMTIKATFPHKLKPQRGLTEQQIMHNMRALAVNCLEPIKQQYPGFRINSGFRQVQNGRSEHETGAAADLQWAGISKSELKAICNWVQANIPVFNQVIYEVPPGSQGWMHISFSQTTNKKQAMTFVGGGTYQPGIV